MIDAVRDRISLDGSWRFAPTPDAPYNRPEAPVFPDESRSITVPGCWQAQFADLVDYADVALYERSFTVPHPWAGRAVRLHFMAVDYLAEVWIDGAFAGKHEGGFLPFCLDVTHLVIPGQEQRLLVRVTDPGGSALLEKQYRAFPDISFKEAPHGKQSWYGPIGGIWQEVYLEAGSSIHLYRALVRPDVAGERAHFRVLLAGPAGPISDQAAPTYTTVPPLPSTAAPPTGASLDGLSVLIQVTGPEGDTYTAGPVAAAAGEAHLTLLIPEPRLWEIDSPTLYEFSAILLDGQRPIDLVQDSFGMRTVEARENRIWLNGKPLYIRAALDQDYYPTTLWTPPSDHFLRDQILLAKQMGLNLLRCHIKVPHPRYLYWADRLGMLVWEEYGNFSHLEGRAGELGQATLEGMIERDFNHPATIIWSVINESWGLDLKRDKDRSWLLEQYAHFKQVDPTRIVVDNSACPGNFHMVSDLADYHSYYAYPEHLDQWEKWVADLAARPSWLWSPHGDAQPTGQEPLLNSEFGNWGLPDAHDLVDENGEEPWWFATGETWSWGIVHPAAVRERFAASVLPTVFGTYKDFVTATQVQQFRAFKHEIEAMRRHGKLNGYVITEWSDVHWECNGLVNQNRQPKAGHHLYPQIIAGTQVMARPLGGQWALSCNEEVRVAVDVASDSPEVADGYRVEWWLEAEVRSPLPGSGTTPGPQAERGALTGLTLPEFGAAAAGEISFRAPPFATRLRLHLTLLDPLGRDVARSFVDFAVFHHRDVDGNLWLHESLSRLAEPLRQIGCKVATGGQPRSGQLAVAARLDDAMAEFVTSGGRLLLLAQGRDALPWEPAGHGGWDAKPERLPLRICERKDTRWQGDWASGWHWLHPDVLARVCRGLLGPGLPTDLENPLDLHWASLLPEHVILGYDPEQQTDWLGGYVLGWIQAPAATAAGFRLGEGAVLVTTFRLPEALLQERPHPAAQALMATLLERAADPQFRPQAVGGPEEALA